jgi:NAD(P)-dependent dehydrogenase (short-subunit alcohol dehydrogenase family)
MSSAADLFGIQGRKALVVGGGYGMGHETSLHLSIAGADVAVADLDLSRAEGVRDEIIAMGAQAYAFGGDVTDRASAEGLVQAAHDALGGLDIVVNIVGAATFAPIIDLDDEAWDSQHTLNVRQQLNVARAAAKLMIAANTPGAIAMVASVSGIYGAPLHGAYGAAKAAVMSLVRTMSQEWGGYGIRVNAVAPDGIATPRVRAGFEARGADMSHLARDTSLKRHGEPRDIAGALLFLVSDLGAFVTGQTIIVDGGVHAQLPHKMEAFEEG